MLVGDGRELAGSGYYFDLTTMRNTARERQLALFHIEGQVYNLELEKHSIVADIGFKVVVAVGTVFKVADIIFE